MSDDLETTVGPVYQPVKQTIRDDGTRVIEKVELLSWGPDPHGMGHVVEVEGRDELAACTACAAGDHDECLDIAADPALHTCQCVEGSCRGEWVDIGYTEAPGIPVRVLGYEHTDEGVIVHAEVNGEVTLGFDAARPESLSDNGDYVKSGSETAGQERDAAWLNQRIAEHRPVPPPVLGAFRIGGELGGVPEDAPELDRFRLNRADRRRLAKRARRG